MSDDERVTERALTLRTPQPQDGAAVWKLVGDTGVLEQNTLYAYLLLCSHFRDTCVVAEESGGEPRRLVGFVGAYCLPRRPEVVFVWQIGVDAAARGRGLGKRLLHHLVELPGCDGVKYLETTVTASNTASLRLFQGFARECGAVCEQLAGYRSELFGDQSHEGEDLYRIGPLGGEHEDD